MERVFVAGGAGFIGSHLIEHLLSLTSIKQVTAYDNLSSGTVSRLEPGLSDGRLRLKKGEVGNLKQLVDAMKGHDTIIHLASNPDIKKAMIEPGIDFSQGTALTNNIVEAMRITGGQTIVYASGSGIYGDLGQTEIAEDYGPLKPVSTYGASKLAGEALVSSYAHMFGLRGLVFRFGNVVGSRQTHGVAFDFMRKLRANPERLEIMGDGNQSKSYVHISDIISAVFIAYEKSKETFDVFNVATGDNISVSEIAKIVIEKMSDNPESVRLVYGGGDRGWKGDVPVVRLNTGKIRGLGWKPIMNSREAIIASVDAMLAQHLTVSHS